jgi:hypothetical protein
MLRRLSSLGLLEGGHLVRESTPTDDGMYRESSFSGGGNCVQVYVNDQDVRIRHSVHHDQGTLVFSHSEWRAFLAGVKDEQFEISSPNK